MVLSVVRFLLLNLVKLLAWTLFKPDIRWMTKRTFDNIRVIALLNHTSLMEPLFVAAIPTPVVWQLASRGVMPGADVTLNRPIVGRLFKWMAPQVIPISRKRDGTWELFMKSLKKDSIILFVPEGRMKRLNGLDKEGKPMGVRGGIADILWQIPDGDIVLAQSGGLHHINVPGSFKVRLFQKFQLRIDKLSIQEYKKTLGSHTELSKFKVAVVEDLNRRLRRPELFGSDLPVLI